MVHPVCSLFYFFSNILSANCISSSANWSNSGSRIKKMVLGFAVPLLRASFKNGLLSPLRGFKSLVDIHPVVQRSLQEGKPVVALESTIITHGMPYPQNINTAQEVEQLVSENGALAATVAIINGRIKVGLTQEEMQQLSSHKEVIKCSRRDLPYLIANKGNGGTTVAATMIIAHMVGIEIFATGGIGGVHRDGHITLDISADLTELGRTPVTVVSSGIKSILDIPRTLEYLETQGVCVATYGVEDCSFPDFYTRDSGCKAPFNLHGPDEAANLIKSLKELKLKSGILIGVPIPKQCAVNKDLIETATQKAIGEANNLGIFGKRVTPYLLKAIAEITKGSSLNANMALIKNNAITAAQIALELSKKNKSYAVRGVIGNESVTAPMVIGASILDLSLTMLDDIPEELDGATYRAHPTESAGGVGRNIAEGILKLYGASNFISVVGNDQLGSSLLGMIPAQLRHCVRVNEEDVTSLCTLLFDKTGDCKIILGNMEIHQHITPEMIKNSEEQFRTAPIIVMDGNLSHETIECVLRLAQKYQRPVFFEPTDMRIAHKPFTLPRSLTEQLKIISPNIYELRAIVEAITGNTTSREFKKCDSVHILMKEVKSLLASVKDYFDCIVLTLGEQGVVISLKGVTAAAGKPLFDPINGSYLPSLESTKNAHSIRFYAAPTVENIKNVSGAGDSFTSGFITALLRGYDIRSCVALGFLAAERALQSSSAVPAQFFKDDAEECEKMQKTIKNLKEIFL